VWVLDRLFCSNWAEFGRLSAPQHYDVRAIICLPVSWLLSSCIAMMPALELSVRRTMGDHSYQLAIPWLYQQPAFSTLACCAVQSGRFALSISLEFSVPQSLALRLMEAQAKAQGLPLIRHVTCSNPAQVQFLKRMALQLRVDYDQSLQALSRSEFGNRAGTGDRRRAYRTLWRVRAHVG
jgi:hypothetical protein